MFCLGKEKHNSCFALKVRFESGYCRSDEPACVQASDIFQDTGYSWHFLPFWCSDWVDGVAFLESLRQDQRRTCS